MIGQACVAAQTLAVRSQISLKSGSVATVKHGDKVGIVDVQRRLVKVLTAERTEGWVDFSRFAQRGADGSDPQRARG